MFKQQNFYCCILIYCCVVENEAPQPSEAMMKCPFSYFEHIPGEVKRTEHQKIQKSIEENMTQSEKEKEREVSEVFQ